MILIVGDTPAPKATTPIPFKDAKCEPRLNEWIRRLGYRRENCRLINRTSDGFEMAVVLAVNFGVPIVALGNNASKALHDMRVNHFKLPHPSGRNRQLNDKAFITDRIALCRIWLRDRT